MIAPPPLIYIAGLVNGALLQALRPAGFVPSALRRPLGLALVAVGVGGFASSLVTMRRVGTHPAPSEPSTALALVGPYRFSRNPIYLSFTLFYSGVAVLANALWIALLLPVVLVVMRRGVIDREERYLERRFGSDYLGYKERVRRWL